MVLFKFRIISIDQDFNANTDFKNIYSNYGVFVGIKNNNDAVIWGRGTHGYNEFNSNNVISNVKDVYFNEMKMVDLFYL